METDATRPDPVAFQDETAHERYGGFSFASAFFGWLIAVALTLVLAGVVGGVATAAGYSFSVTATEARQEVDTLGLAAGVALLAILLVAYFSGGYVAGRMSRFDGGRQGFGAWLLGLILTVAVSAAGAVFGAQYNIFEQIRLPALPVPTDTLTVGGIVALVVIVVGTLLAAVLGGKTGQRYHRKVDRASF